MKKTSQSSVFFRTAGVIATGLLAYVLEYGFGLNETPLRYVVYLIGIPILILYALANAPVRLTGRLKGANSLERHGQEVPGPRDALFNICMIIYGGVYLSALFRVRPRDFDRFFEIFMVLSPVELFWLAAPITVFWWYRQSVIKRRVR